MPRRYGGEETDCHAEQSSVRHQPAINDVAMTAVAHPLMMLTAAVTDAATGLGRASVRPTATGLGRGM